MSSHSQVAPVDGPDGEVIVFRAELTDRWIWLRQVTCCLQGIADGIIGPLFFGLPYCLFGGPARKEEYQTFSLYVTTTAIHWSQKLHGCGMCCPSTSSKVIPLDKVTDVVITASCFGDPACSGPVSSPGCCGFVEKAGTPYIVSIQTASDGGGAGAELELYCLSDPLAFRGAVMNAKRALLSGNPALQGASKAGTLNPVQASTPGQAAYPALSPAGASAGSDAQVLATLQGIERSINEGLTLLRAQHRL